MLTRSWNAGRRVPLLDEAWLTLVSPVWPRGYARLIGAAGIVEGLFLLAISGTAPVGDLAMKCLLAGEIVFVASFAPSISSDS